MVESCPVARKIFSFFALLFSDFLAVAAALGLGLILLGPTTALSFSAGTGEPKPGIFVGWVLALFAPWIFAIASEKLYTRRPAAETETLLLMKSATVASAFLLAASFLNPRFIHFSRPALLLAWVASFISLPLLRSLAKKALIRAGLWKKRVLLISSDRGVEAVIQSIRGHRTLGYDLIGVLTERDRGGAGTGRRLRAIGGIPVLGTIDDLESLKARAIFDHLIINLPDLPGDRLSALLRRWENMSEVIHYIPRTGNVVVAGVEAEAVGGILSLTVRRNLAKPWNILTKRVFDFALALVLLILLAPLGLLIALAIRADTSGPVFFSQARYGRKGRLIRLLKFRSMFRDADDRLAGHLAAHPRQAAEWNKFRKLKCGDPRVTSAGRFLRRFSLDELPQLVNVLRGEMSLVGPRPYLTEELREMESLKSILLQVRPGLTGLWQVSGRSDVPFSERLNLDEHYVRNWSFWLDIVILLKTPWAAVRGQGAF